MRHSVERLRTECTWDITRLRTLRDTLSILNFFTGFCSGNAAA